MQFVLETLRAFWELTEEMAPYLLLGFACATLLRAFVDDAWVRRHLGARGWRQTVKAALLGVPLPLCSCGVIPVAASLRRQGGRAGAVTSFTASTPQTGVDSIFATAGLLNWPFALVRTGVAFVTGVVAGTLVDRFAGDPAVSASPESTEEKKSCCGGPSERAAPVAQTSCCGGEMAAPAPSGSCCGGELRATAQPTAATASSCCGQGQPPAVPAEATPAHTHSACCGVHGASAPASVIATEEASCCGHREPAPAPASTEGGCCCGGSAEAEKATSAQPSASSCCAGSAPGRPDWAQRFAEAARFGLLVLPADIGKALLFGLALAAVLTVALPQDLAASTWTTGLMAYLATTIVAVPLYVCATGSIPMAYALLHAGFSPGAAMVFLIAGPATNTATVSALWKMIGGRAVAIYLATLIGIAWIAGYAFDRLGADLGHVGAHAHLGAGGTSWKTFAAVVLLGLLAVAYLRPQRWFRRGA